MQGYRLGEGVALGCWEPIASNLRPGWCAAAEGWIFANQNGETLDGFSVFVAFGFGNWTRAGPVGRHRSPLCRPTRCVSVLVAVDLGAVVLKAMAKRVAARRPSLAERAAFPPWGFALICRRPSRSGLGCSCSRPRPVAPIISNKCGVAIRCAPV